MSVWQEAKQSVGGAVRVMRMDPNALQDFNLTIDGYWRSFYAAVYLAPIYILFLLSVPVPQDVSIGRFWLIEIINYPLNWALWPLISYYICRGAGLVDKYTTYITVYNWAQIILSGLRMALIIIAFALFPLAVTSNLIVLSLIVVLAAEALIIRLTLDVSWPQALLIESLAFVIALLLGLVKQFVMMGGGPV
ncbi:MAG: hypothetical protein OXC54_03630 [Rhodospirillaceae bacterium]|nr:hypothetical protein [Rhodospirillaceae bacterium]MCY4238358.1 hypothetical protein [Rhodospirillaceae bacterium]MCY4310393.1 hypothetical protein [Rhodospirillaceae bacterium]